MKTAVIGEDSDGGKVEENHEPAFSPKPAGPYRAKTKGKLERAFRYIREDFFLGGSFRDEAARALPNEQRRGLGGRGDRLRDRAMQPARQTLAPVAGEHDHGRKLR